MDNQARIPLNYLWLGELALVNGQQPKAHDYFVRAIRQSYAERRLAVLLLGLEGMARTHIHDGSQDDALATLYFIIKHPNTWEFARKRVKSFLADIECNLSSEELSRAVETSRTMELDHIVYAWLSSISSHAPA